MALQAPSPSQIRPVLHGSGLKSPRMESKPTLAELRDRLRQLQAGVDETIRALDSVDDEPRAAPAARPQRANMRPESVTMRESA